MLPALSDNSLKADHEAGIDPHRGTGSVVAGAIVDVERVVEAGHPGRVRARPAGVAAGLGSGPDRPDGYAEACLCIGGAELPGAERSAGG